MTNNLKILTILSIFVFILTGYFCFSSPSVKNQIIANNNNNEKDNKNSKDISKINNKDEKKIKIENKKNTSWLIYVILLIIIVIVIAVIVIFVVNKKNEFKFNEESEKDFAKENFCPTFFMIETSKVIGEFHRKNEKFSCIDNLKDFKENADNFFEILARFIFFDVSKNYIYYNSFFNSVRYNNNKEKKIAIYLTDNSSEKNFVNEDYFMIDFQKILEEINDFAFCSENASDDKILENLIGEQGKENNILQKIKNFKENKEKILKEKYNSNLVLFNSYLHSYLLLYLVEIFRRKDEHVEINICKITNSENYDYMYKILKNLLHEFPYSYKENEDNSELIINCRNKINEYFIKKIPDD